MLRLLSGTKLSDRVSSKSILEKYGLKSVNQLAASIKLTEVWKSINKDRFPLRLDPYKTASKENTHELRQNDYKVFKENCRLHKSEASFHVDAVRIWNAAPISIKNAISLNIAKKTLTFFASHCLCNAEQQTNKETVVFIVLLVKLIHSVIIVF